jgi:anti-anti-sigma factor
VSLALTVRQDVTVLAVSGDVLNEESLRAALGVLNERGPRALYLDFAAVRFPTAEGLGLLATLNKELRERGGKLTLLNVAPDPYEVFEVTGLLTVLDVRPLRRGAEVDGGPHR